MTNPPSSGGMPKWLIVVLVIFLVLILGCCGGFYACTHFLGKVAAVGAEKLKEQAQKGIYDAQTRQASELKNHEPQPAPTGITQENTTPSQGNKSNTHTDALPEITNKMPSNFPSDIPIHYGMTPTNAVADKIHGAGSVTLESTDNVDTLADFYEKQMAAKGWTIDANTTINGNTIQGYTKDTRRAAITILSENGMSHVSITYGPK